MLSETIEIDCDKEQLDRFDKCFTEQCQNGDGICLWARVWDGRLQFTGFSHDIAEVL
jgi:hypothetical protein